MGRFIGRVMPGSPRGAIKSHFPDLGGSDRLSRFGRSALGFLGITRTSSPFTTSGFGFELLHRVEPWTENAARARGAGAMTRTAGARDGCQIAEGLAKAHAAESSTAISSPRTSWSRKTLREDPRLRTREARRAAIDGVGMPTLARPETHPGSRDGPQSDKSPGRRAASDDFRSASSLSVDPYEVATDRGRSSGRPRGDDGRHREDPEPIGKAKPRGSPALALDRRSVSREGSGERTCQTRDLDASARVAITSRKSERGRGVNRSGPGRTGARRSMVLESAIILLLAGSIADGSSRPSGPETSAPSLTADVPHRNPAEQALTPDGQDDRLRRTGQERIGAVRGAGPRARSRPSRSGTRPYSQVSAERWRFT